MEPSPGNSKRPPAASKPKIDPLQLLKCLSILLNANGGIRGETEVPRVKGLMSKYSKKLVSKCIYLNILQATDLTLLDSFYDEGGWELVGTWLQEAVKASNWPLAMQVLSLLETSPMTVTRLKRYATPRLVKELSRDCINSDVQNVSKQIVLKWMDVVRQGDGSGTMAGVGLSGVGSSVDSPPVVDDASDSVGESSNATEQPANAMNSDSAHEGGDVSSSGEGQDESSNASTESDTTPAPTTPIRITIRSGSQVLAKVSSQRESLESNESDDNKPLSIIKKEVKKSQTNEDSSDATLPDLTPGGESAVNGNMKNEAATDSESSALTENASGEEGTGSLPSKNGAILNTDKGSDITESNVSVTKTTMNTSETSSGVSSSGIVCNSVPSSSETEGDSAMETNSEVEKVSDNGVMDSDSQEKKCIIDSNENSDKEKVDENESGKDDNVLKTEKESKSSKDRSKEKDKDKLRDSEKKDKKEKEHEKEKRSKDDKKKDREKDSRSSKSSSSSSSRSDKSSKNDKHKSSSSSHSKSSKDKDKDRESNSKNKDRDRESSSKDRDRDKSKSSSSRDKDKKSSSSSRDKSKDKEREGKHDKKKEQENEDKATLEKVKPLSADGLAKIPRKSTPASFLDALGSADLDGLESKKPSVKTYKSRGFRNTGLLDEPTKPPGKKAQGTGANDKKSATGTAGQGVKRPSPLDELVASSDKRIKSSVSSSPLTSDKPGGVKLISPKRPSLSDDGGFMAALTASGADTRKKITRKRKSSESEKQEGGKEEDKKEEDKTSSPLASPIKDDKDVMLSPTSVKPTFNFYQETLKDDDNDEDKKEGKEDTSDSKEEEEPTENGGDVEMKDDTPSSPPPGDNDSDNMDIEESEDQDDNVQIGLGENYVGDGINGRCGESGIRDEDIPIAPAVPAPAQEDYEKVEVTFSQPTESVRGVLVYHRPEDRKKKSVKWKTEDDLKEVFYFEMDETERVNVNTIKFNEMMALDKQREREAMGKSRGMHGHMMGGNMNMMGGNNHMMGMGMHHGGNGIEYMRWSLLPIMIPASTVTPGCKSQERITQAARESSTMAAFYNPAMLPETPREPDPEMVSRTEPKEIPLTDVTGQDMVYDHRNKLWPEPVFTEPMNYGYGGMGGPSNSGNDGGSHWVVGGPPAGGFPGPGGPMYGGPGGFNGPGMGGPGMGGPGMGGPPGGFGGDMGGGMDVPGGWGGPVPGPPGGLGPPAPGMDYPNQNMMMGGGNQGMMMGGGGGGGRGPRGMMPNMNMGGQGFRGRNGPGGGNWGGPGHGPGNYGKPVCIHFMNGHCRHGAKCRYLHGRR